MRNDSPNWPALEAAFGAAIRRKRKKRGLRRADVARAMRVRLSWVESIEQGKRPLDVIEYALLAVVVGFNPWKLMRKIWPDDKRKRRR
jgi:transcriptional regulator with XRE-family HTH domain